MYSYGLSLCPIAVVTSGVYLCIHLYFTLFHFLATKKRPPPSPTPNSWWALTCTAVGPHCAANKKSPPISPSYTIKRQNQGQSVGMFNIQTNARISKTSQLVQNFVQQQHQGFLHSTIKRTDRHTGVLCLIFMPDMFLISITFIVKYHKL